MRLAVKREVASDFQRAVCAGFYIAGLKFDLRIVRDIEDIGAEHPLLNFGALFWIETWVEHAHGARVHHELNGATGFIHSPARDRRLDGVIVAGEAEDAAAVDVHRDRGSRSVDGPLRGKNVYSTRN